eukprot:CAMPEP_0194570742 /NCGR_PEP_ID=MMETSP0292-20121207/7948_1 /TAXON_ID=39354 /ORGANISM="Heterosigma akashiwo, Strain CCMP2393" /LENGTH=304 /DNA_ID=CAMNT_0039421277 /DNA_START=59 /DNA_END=973 /DNA_ORIENTATION=+
MRPRTKVGAILFGAVSPFMGWSFYSEYRRNLHSPDSLEFNIASIDAQFMNTLRTGDIIFFRRNPFMLQPLQGILSWATKLLTGCDFDQCGVILNDRYGTPHVFEFSHSGITLTRYDHRIKLSMAEEIVLLPLIPESSSESKTKRLTEQLERAKKAAVRAQIEQTAFIRAQATTTDNSMTPAVIPWFHLNGLMMASLLELKKTLGLVEGSTEPCSTPFAHNKKTKDPKEVFISGQSGQQRVYHYPQVALVLDVLNSMGALSQNTTQDVLDQQKSIFSCENLLRGDLKLKGGGYYHGNLSTIRARR